MISSNWILGVDNFIALGKLSTFSQLHATFLATVQRRILKLILRTSRVYHYPINEPELSVFDVFQTLKLAAVLNPLCLAGLHYSGWRTQDKKHNQDQQEYPLHTGEAPLHFDWNSNPEQSEGESNSRVCGHHHPPHHDPNSYATKIWTQENKISCVSVVKGALVYQYCDLMRVII